MLFDEAAAVIDDFRGEYRWLSNFHLVDVTYQNQVYRSTEHAYMAAKSTDLEWRKIVQNALTPREAKRLGRLVNLRPEWESIKVAIMENLLRQKFEYPELRAKLLATGDAELIEGNTWNDKFWGVCNGEGLNVLGKLLMKIRKDIRDSI